MVEPPHAEDAAADDESRPRARRVLAKTCDMAFLTVALPLAGWLR